MDRGGCPGGRHRVVLDQRPGLGILEDQGTVVRRQAVIDRGNDSAEPADREERLEEGDMVRADPGDAIATDDPETIETGRKPADPLGQLGVGDRPVPADERRAIWIDPRSPFDPRADADVCRCLEAHRCRMPSGAAPWRARSDGAPGRAAGEVDVGPPCRTRARAGASDGRVDGIEPRPDGGSVSRYCAGLSFRRSEARDGSDPHHGSNALLLA